jgi:hypothetical protein
MDARSLTMLNDLFNHGLRWLANLRRAKLERKQQSILALRKMISASRETSVYIRLLSETGQSNHKVERDLTLLWTDLGFALEDLGLTKLAKRCQVTGKHWSNPEHYSAVFLEKSDISLDKMEKLAHLVLADINRH